MYMTLTPPPHTDSWLPSEISKKIECSDVLQSRFVVRHRTEFLKAYSESLFQGGTGHILNSFVVERILEVSTGFYCGKTSRIRSTTF
jgi:hypothetical protein